MAGSNAGFSAAAFRTAIRAAMTMGAANTVADQATFRWTVERTFATHDPGGNPYLWSDTPTTTTTHPDVIIPVAVEFAGGTDDLTSVGEFDISHARLTVLDVDFALIEGADQVLLGQNTYNINFVAPPVGLFEVDVYTLFIQAQDES